MSRWVLSMISDLWIIPSAAHCLPAGSSQHSVTSRNQKSPPFSGVSDAIHHLFAKTTAGKRQSIRNKYDVLLQFPAAPRSNTSFFSFPAECSFSRGTLTTFNKRRHYIPTFLSCPQTLSQDCTDELKFIVLLKKDEGELYSVNVKIAWEWVFVTEWKECKCGCFKRQTHKIKHRLFCTCSDIDLYQKNHKVFVKVNEMDIPLTTLPYRSSTGFLTHFPATIKILHLSGIIWYDNDYVLLKTCV